MLDRNELDFETIDYRTLSPAQWTLVKRRLTERAHAERSQVLRDYVAALGALVRRGAVAAIATVADWRKANGRRRAANRRTSYAR